jgi:hypothetical protein
MIVPFDDEDKAHFLCGLLNSEIGRMRINRSITSEAHKDIINVLPLQKFDRKNKLHNEIVKMSKQLHNLAQDGRDLEKLESKLNSIVKELWKIG